MPPVTFRLQAGSGPVHISGQHFVSEYFPLYQYKQVHPCDIVRTINGININKTSQTLINHCLLFRSERC